MNDPLPKLQAANWQRKLTPAEEAELHAWFAAHPEARADWEAEAALSRALDHLPNAPLSSNFTARVLQAVELETAATQRQSGINWSWVWRSLIPKTALASVFVGMGLMAFREARFEKQQRFAKSIKTVSAVAALPSPEVLQDFEVIQQFSPTRPPDLELLALLQ